MNMSLFGIYVLSNLMEMSIEHDGRPLTRLIVGLEKYLIELTAGSVVHSYFLLTCSLTDLSFSYLVPRSAPSQQQCQIFLCTDENSKGLRATLINSS